MLNDLAPAATFIAANYNLPFDVQAFAKAGKKLLAEVGQELGWMYETLHTDGKKKGRIEYTIWSGVFTCPDCTDEVVFLDEALDEETKWIRDSFPCPHCGSELTKGRLEKTDESYFDALTNKLSKGPKRNPVRIVCVADSTRYEKKPDHFDIQRIEQIDQTPFPSEFPRDRMMHSPDDVECWGDKWRAGTASFSHVHHLFLPRAVHTLAALWRKAIANPDLHLQHMLLIFVEQAVWGMSVLARYAPIHFQASDLGVLPYDFLQAGRKLSFNLGDIFPNLSYPVATALDRGVLDTLYEAQKRYTPDHLGDNATKGFVLLHVFEIAPELIKQPSDLLSRHYRSQRIPAILDERFIQLLRQNNTFDDWPLKTLIPDREVFFGFLQERWPIFLDRLAAKED